VDDFFEWAFQLWPDWFLWVIIPWAFLAIPLGALVVIVVSVDIIRHYGFGKPLDVRKNGVPATPAQTLMELLAGGAVGSLFMVLGVLLLRWRLG